MTKGDLSLGFVGLGALGLPMAINLEKAGFPLRVHTRSGKPALFRLIAMGRPSAPSPTKPTLRSPLVMTHREAFGSWSTDALQLCLQNKKSRKPPFERPPG